MSLQEHKWIHNHMDSTHLTHKSSGPSNGQARILLQRQKWTLLLIAQHLRGQHRSPNC